MDPISLVMTVLGLVLAVIALPWVARRIEDRRRDRQIRKGAAPKEFAQEMNEVELLAQDRLYYHRKGWVKAVRLFGAGSEFVPASRLSVTYEHVPLVIVPELRQLRDQTVQRRQEEAVRDGKEFFDGPNSRLLKWRSSPRSDARAGLEEPCLELWLGPVGWYDFEGLNAAFRENQGATKLALLYDYYVGLPGLISDGSVGGSRLSNILDNAITLVSNDGYVGYQRRSSRVSASPGLLTSAVAENTNRFLDDAEPGDPLQLHNDRIDSTDPLVTAPSDYEPRGVPHPVAAVRRGISSEISPRVLDVVRPNDIHVIGISFDLEGFHPNLLVAVLVDMPHAEILASRREEPGKEHREGSLHFVPANRDDPATRTVLETEKWVPAGQASLVRTLELLHHVAREQKADLDGVFRLLRGRC